MASADLQDEEYSHWNNCPPDVLMLIFNYLNLDSISNCTVVNKTWREIAIYYFDHYKLWDKLVYCLYNNGESFKQKSIHDTKQLYLNAVLWQNVSNAKRDIKDYYQTANIKHIHVSKDTLIVVCESCVKILDVNTFSLLKTLNITCTDYRESAHLTTIVSGPLPGIKRLLTLDINQKKGCFCSKKDRVHLIPKITLYSLQEKGCYILDDTYTLWIFTHQCGQHLELLARYYGPRGPVYSVSVHTTGVFVFLLSGCVLHVDEERKNMSIMYRFIAPGDIFNLTPLVFDRFTVVYGIADYRSSSELYENAPKNAKVLIFPKLSAATLHGDLLLLGFDDGVFGIYKPSTMSIELGGKPELEFRIQFSDQPPLAIREVDVYEGDGKHIIFALIGDRIAKIEMSYPQFSDTE